MKMLYRFSTILTAILGLVSVARADQYAFSYTFGPNSPYNDNSDGGEGFTASGTFDGTANGNLITGISNVTLAVGINLYAPGYPPDILNLPALSVGSYSNDFSYVAGAAVVSFDGTQNDFLFINADPNNPSASDSDIYSFDSITGYLPQLFGDFTDEFVSIDGGGQFFANNDVYPPISPNDDGQDSSWSVKQVPDESVTAFLAAGTVSGLALMRRRFARSWSR